MRILHFSDCFFPEMSGIYDSIRTTSQALIELGHEVAFVAPRYSSRNYGLIHPQGFDACIMGPSGPFKTYRLPSFGIPLSPTGQSRTAIPIGASLEFVSAFRPDILHAHTPWGSGWEAVMAGRRLRLPVIGTNHTVIEEFARYSGMLARPLGPALKRYASVFYNRLSFVTAPCRSLIEDMRADGFRGLAQSLPNPVALVKFRPAGNDLKRALRIKHGLTGPTILYAGRLAPEKNVDQILRAMALLKDNHPNLGLVVTGFGSAGPQLQQLAAELEIENRVKFVGFVDEATLVELYQASDAFAMMSTAETQSIALMQAMGSGLPVLAARAGALPEFVKPEFGALVEPRDAEDLARELDRLFSCAETRRRLGARAAQFVKRFSTETIASQWERVYGGMLRKRAAA